MAIPVITTQNLAWGGSETHPAPSMLSVTTDSPIIEYEIWQSLTNTGGAFYLNNVRKEPHADLLVSAADFANLEFRTGSIAATETIQIRARNSTGWNVAASAPWSPFSITVSAATGGPVLAVSDQIMPKYTEYDLEQLFTATLDQGRPITQYQAISALGNLVVGGVKSAPGSTVAISVAQMPTTLIETLETNDTVKIRAYDGTKWGAWASFAITLSNIYGPHVVEPQAGWGSIGLNVFATATAQNPIPPTRRVMIDWTNNLDRAIDIRRVNTSIGLPMPTPPDGQYLYAVQVIRAADGEKELIYPGGHQDSPGLSGGVQWNDYRDFPECAMVIQPQDKLHFVIDGYTLGADFVWSVNFQVYFQ
jgi:hypothetical protein